MDIMACSEGSTSGKYLPLYLAFAFRKTHAKSQKLKTLHTRIPDLQSKGVKAVQSKVVKSVFQGTKPL